MNHITHRPASLQNHLDDMAQRLVDLGSGAESARLGQLAAAIRHIAPGTAAALEASDESEISRLRAFAVAAARTSQLSDVDRDHLLDSFEGRSPMVAAA